MTKQEKKYQVNSLIEFSDKLINNGASRGKTRTSTHYYGQQESSDVKKLVVYDDRLEIHILKSIRGKFELIKTVPVANKQAGLTWLKERGFNKLDLIEMKYTNYSYKDSVVGLYNVNGIIDSIIVECESKLHASIEKDLGLEGCKVLTSPYNKQLTDIGENIEIII